MKTTLRALSLLTLLSVPIAAQETRSERIEVPLSKPGEPG